MFKFTFEWVTSMAKWALIERGVPEAEAEELISHGDEWLVEEKLQAARTEMLNLIECCKDSIAWTENNFIPGPNSEAHIKAQNTIIEKLTEYIDDRLGGMPS